MEPEPSRADGLDLPTCYRAGYARARALDPKTASNYVAHARVGDPVADAMMAVLEEIGPRDSWRIIQRVMDDLDDERALKEAPREVRDFFEELKTPPDWVDEAALIPGMRMFHRNSRIILGAFVGGTLVEGFSTNISKSFFTTGRLREQGVRRLKQNNRHMLEMFVPGGMDRGGDGWKLSVRVRMVHAQVRRLIANSGDWDFDELGTPVSSAHLGFAITAFSARLLKHMKSLGAVYDDEERASFMQVWRYGGYLMGIPESILYRDEAEALHIFKIGGMCEPEPDFESIAMANSLINSAPLLIGLTDPEERRHLAKYVYRVSRALIGKELANKLKYPRSPTVGVLPWFRMQGRIERTLGRLFQKHMRQTNYTNLTSLLEVSVFDEAGISYKLPDHVYAEESGQW